ncbi:hypothetical protein [Roseibium salinum]|uniref:EVE domain-containing protein n=1 Tax=Roseibium salinum TaxID=1604349 RepID=A0ABT3R653_9HYPH|nr:hypothetical protein [Roseibium sp. DSM 29163]MCX2724637.1 hypothetical protein [Roseibium sp. DSM 29163]MDN3721374.1 hypothetical protein [Roseibium salinum]
MAYAIKAEIRDPQASTNTLPARKTMYGGKRIAAGDTVYIFASENEGGPGLIARGTVTSATPVPKIPDVERQTPRVDVEIRRDATAKRPLGRAQLKSFRDWEDGLPETELNFKLYRQATNKIVGLTDEAASYFGTFF